MFKWHRVRIGDVAEVKGGKRLPKGSALQEENNGAPYIRITDWFDGAIDPSNLMFVPESAQGAIDRYRVHQGDVFVSIVGTIGLVAEITDNLDGAFLSENAAKITLTDGSMHTSFLKYALLSGDGQNEILSRSVGSTQPKLALHRIKDIHVPCPPIRVQNDIAEVLGALDDKIAANTKTIHTSMALMRASFSDLVLQADSRRTVVESVVSRLNPPRKFAKAEIRTTGDFPVFDQSEVGLLGYLSGTGSFDASVDSPIIYFGDHTCKLRVSAEPFTVGPNTIAFIGKNVSSTVLYCALDGVQRLEEYKRHWQSLMKKEIVLPSQAAGTQFANRFKVVLSQRQSLTSENETIAAIRDALLPMLMTGKLRVKDAEKLVEAAV